MTNDGKTWYTVKDACTYLQVSPMTLYRWMKGRKLSFFKMGGSLRFRQEDLDKVARRVPGDTKTKATPVCAVCGGTELVDGRLQSTGRLYFKPGKTRFFVFTEALVGTTAMMCTACGHVQMFADTEKLHRLRPDASADEAIPAGEVADADAAGDDSGEEDGERR